MARKPRFEIVRTDTGHHARFVAANGRIVWWTENYQRRIKALHAIGLIAADQVRKYGDEYEVIVAFNVDPNGLLEVREIDERTS